MQRYLSISDLAERAGITVETARTYGKQGRLPGPDVSPSGLPILLW